MPRDACKSGKAIDMCQGYYWWIIASLAALISSSMLLHESASWALGFTEWLGRSWNVRALSCDAHSLGLIVGYILTQISDCGFRRAIERRRFWLAFFLVQLANVVLFYVFLVQPDLVMAIVVVQFIGACSGTFFFIALSPVASYVPMRQFVATIVFVVAASTFVVQGLFSLLELTAPFVVSALLHISLVVVAAICFARGCGEDSLYLASLRSREFSPVHSCDTRRIPLYLRLLFIIGSYGFVFGFLHVIPLALPLGAETRVVSFLAGGVVALALFVMIFHDSDVLDIPILWKKFYQLVFPLVIVATLLAPLSMSIEFLPSLIVQACALYYFDALLALSCYVVSRTINAPIYQVLARAFLTRTVGFALGSLVGGFVIEGMPLDAGTFSIIGTIVFLLLFLVTFNMNSERNAKTVWGLLPHEDPRGRYERTLDERCEELACAHGLTEREAEVLHLLARGKRPKEISDTLVVSVATVRSHVHAIYTKTDVHSAEELTRLINE